MRTNDLVSTAHSTTKETRDVSFDKIHGKLREIGLKVKQGGHICTCSKSGRFVKCKAEQILRVALYDCAAKKYRNRFNPGMLFFSFFHHILA